MALASMRVGDVVLDMTVYPRHQPDPYQLRELKMALEAGAKFPPIVLEHGTRRCVDGFHRTMATKAILGDDALVAVDERKYETEAALFQEAMFLNSRHGQGLTKYDRVRCILMARKMGIADEETASRLQITMKYFEDTVLTRTATGPDAEMVPLKSTSGPRLAGRMATVEQLAANQRSSGMPVGFYVAQLINALNGDLVNWDDAALCRRLEDLAGLLGDALAKRPGGA